MPKIVVIAGPNGAGKSTSAPAVLRDTLKVREFVNADAIAAELSAASPDTVAIPAGRAMLQRLRELVDQRHDLAFETTLASRSFAPWIRHVQSTGYKFHLVYLWLPIVELAIARVEERVRRGGHAIPEAVIRRRYDRSLDNLFNIYMRFADSWLMLDNSLEPRPHVVAKRATKRSVRVVDIGWWSALCVKYERQSPDEE